MSCAPSRMFVFKMAFDTSDSAVNGGQMTMSTSLTLNSSRFKPFTRSSASATVLFIFQLPAIMSLRFLFIVAGRRFRCSAPSFVCQCRDARQHFAFEKFQACAAAGADERHLLGRSEEHTSELQSRLHLVCRLLLEKKKKTIMCAYTGDSLEHTQPFHHLGTRCVRTITVAGVTRPFPGTLHGLTRYSPTCVAILASG